MIGTANTPGHQRKIEAGRAANRIHDQIAAIHAGARQAALKIDPRSRSGRIRGLRALAAAQGSCSLGAAHDANCMVGFWSYLSTMNSRSLYKGIGVVANAIHFGSKPVRCQNDFDVESGLEVLIDLHVMKRLALRADAMDAESQMAILRPVVAWCAAANQCGITGRFVVPTRDGMFFCRREILPEFEGQETGELSSRIVSFYSFDEMRKTYLESWKRMQAAGILDSAPAYPRLERAGKEELIKLFFMAGEDLVLRTALEARPQNAQPKMRFV